MTVPPETVLHVALDVTAWTDDPSTSSGRATVALIQALLTEDPFLDLTLIQRGRVPLAGLIDQCLPSTQPRRLVAAPLSGRLGCWWRRGSASRSVGDRATPAGTVTTVGPVDVVHLTGGIVPRGPFRDAATVVGALWPGASLPPAVTRWAAAHATVVLEATLAADVPNQVSNEAPEDVASTDAREGIRTDRHEAGRTGQRAALRRPMTVVVAPPRMPIPALATSGMAAVHTIRVHWGLGTAPYCLTHAAVDALAPFEELLGAMESLPEEAHRIQWVIAGDGPALPTLTARVSRSPIAHRVRLVGEQNDATLAALRLGAVALLQPAGRSSADAAAALAALTAGVPLFVVPGSVAHAIAGDAAQLSSWDPESRVRALAIFLGDATVRDRMAHLGIERAKTYSWRRTARDTHAAYSAAVTRWRDTARARLHV
jgi:hypothetical protein